MEYLVKEIMEFQSMECLVVAVEGKEWPESVNNSWAEPSSSVVGRRPPLRSESKGLVKYKYQKEFN